MGFPGGSVVRICLQCSRSGFDLWMAKIPWRRDSQPIPMYSWASLAPQIVKNPSAMWETWVGNLGWEDPLKEGMASHSSILAWRIPWTEEPGWLQSMGLQRVGHDWACTCTQTSAKSSSATTKEPAWPQRRWKFLHDASKTWRSQINRLKIKT